MFNTQVEFKWVQGAETESEWNWSQEILPGLERLTVLPALPRTAQSTQIVERLTPTGRKKEEASPGAGRFAQIILRGMVTLCALAFLTAAAAPDSEWERTRRLKRDISVTVAHDVDTWRTADEAAFSALLDTKADTRWQRDLERTWQRTTTNDTHIPQVQVASVARYGEYALVATNMTQPDSIWGSAPYRQYRFYRQEDGRWLRTFPTDAFWGETQVLETPHIRFEFRTWDAPIINETAVRLERIYTALYKTMDVPPPLASEKLTLQVMPRSNSSWSIEGEKIRVPSYISVTSDPALSEAEVFMQTVSSGLTYHVLRDVRAPRGWSYSSLWNAIFPGLHSWLMSSASDQNALLDAQAETLLRQQIEAEGALRMVDLSYMPLPTEDADEWLWRMRAGEMVLDYLAETYGADEIPRFVDGLTVYSAWATLFPTMYDMSLKEFEADWNAYLQEILFEERGRE